MKVGIQIKNNYFSKEKLHIEIEDKAQDLKIHGDIQYHHHEDIKTSFVSPNIMGPFSYIPFMECNHAILSMKTHIQGNLQINGENRNLDNGIGYLEKDWGKSFPKSYIWCQGNCFQNTDASFILSIADIPFKVLTFQGIICVLLINHHEYRFTTYHHTQIQKYEVSENSINITLKKGIYELNVKSVSSAGKKLLAPVKGKMEKDILESICSSIVVTLRRNNAIIFKDTSTNCGLEIV